MSQIRTAVPKTLIASVREFNRFYTRQIGLLNESILDSEFSLSEARVLYELAQRDDFSASELGRVLELDAGYLSRILKKFAARGLIRRTPSPHDGRQHFISLTEIGRTRFAPLDRASHDEVAALLARLAPQQQQIFARALKTVAELLSAETQTRAPSAPSYTLRPLQVGDIGWITHRQAVLYAQEYGWNEQYEALVAEILAQFVHHFDAASENCWIAERADAVVGSVFLVRESDTVAKLRLLYVEPSTRGLGIGRRLVDECVHFARDKGYRTLTLWTNSVLSSARRIYEAAGFKLVKEEAHHSFGKDLIGQNWDLIL